MMTSARPTMLTVIACRWRMILRNTVLAGALVAGLSLLLHNQFTATTELLPPDTQSDLTSMLSSVPGAMALSRLTGMDMNSGTNLYIGVMRSSRVAAALTERFQLIGHYRVKDSEKARKQLAVNTSIEISEEGMIRIAVTDRDARLAADMANAYVSELDRFLRENGSSTARARRTFLDQRIAAEKADLSAVEDSLRDFQMRSHLPALPPDAQRSIGAATELIGRRAAIEIELGTLDKLARAPSARAEELRMQLSGIDAQIVRIPPATTTIGRLYRVVKTHEAVLVVLTQEYERAKLQELKDTPTVDVLDHATPPIHKSGPHRTLMVLAALAVAGVISSLFAWAREGSVRAT